MLAGPEPICASGPNEGADRLVAVNRILDAFTASTLLRYVPR
jgi:hypothetical protein